MSNSILNVVLHIRNNDTRALFTALDILDLKYINDKNFKSLMSLLLNYCCKFNNENAANIVINKFKESDVNNALYHIESMMYGFVNYHTLKWYSQYDSIEPAEHYFNLMINEQSIELESTLYNIHKIYGLLDCHSYAILLINLANMYNCVESGIVNRMIKLFFEDRIRECNLLKMEEMSLYEYDIDNYIEYVARKPIHIKSTGDISITEDELISLLPKSVDINFELPSDEEAIIIMSNNFDDNLGNKESIITYYKSLNDIDKKKILYPYYKNDSEQSLSADISLLRI